MLHPTPEVSVKIDGGAYQQLGLQEPRRGSGAKMSALVDTGAQMCILGRSQVHELGITLEELEPASLGITIVDGGKATNLGMVFLEISASTPKGELRTTRQQCYVLDGAGSLFLSYEALIDLGSCPRGFPEVGVSSPMPTGFELPQGQVRSVYPLGGGSHQTPWSPQPQGAPWRPRAALLHNASVSAPKEQGLRTHLRRCLSSQL